jgi:hypothetical protein
MSISQSMNKAEHFLVVSCNSSALDQPEEISSGSFPTLFAGCSDSDLIPKIVDQILKLGPM